MIYDIIIIGAGASGLMAGVAAAEKRRSVLIVDHAGEIGRKILASGGGRCNFTNVNIGPANYRCATPDFVEPAVADFGPRSAIGFFSNNGIEWEEREHGRIFGKHSSRLITVMFGKLLKKKGVRILTRCEVLSVEKDAAFSVSTSLGRFSSRALIVATGGLSHKKLSATGLGHEIAKKFGHKIVPAQPALVGLVFQPSDQKRFKPLAGISLNACVTTACGRTFEDGILFTHKGLSGPAILNASLYWKKGEALKIKFLPPVPKRLVALGPLFDVAPSSRASFENAEVTLGGVDTAGISAKTMGSKPVKGLYFTGEVMDVTGELGGYNLHWAWASGFAAGSNI